MNCLDPKADLPFKRVFGEHPDLVMSLLNALLPLKEGEEITDIEYLTPEMVPDNPLRKDSIVDVRCRDRRGRQFIVEMQMVWSPEFQYRVLFNASKAYVRQLDSGKDYKLLQPVYSLNLVNDIFEPELEGYYHHYALVHTEHNDRVIKGLELVFIELPKFTPSTFSEKKMQVLWLRYLTEIKDGTREVAPDLLAVPEVNKAINILQESAFTEGQLLAYDRFWDVISREVTYYNSGTRKGLAEGKKEGLEEGRKEGLEKGIKKGMKEGRKKGLEEGKKKGREEGMKEGIQKGREEGIEEGRRKALLEVARRLKSQGVTIEMICASTGFSPEEISAL